VSYVPSRGDLVWIEFDPQAGHQQAGRRPAIVLSPKEYNERVGLMLCCPITSRIKGYPFEVLLPEGLGITGAVLCDQVRNFDWHARRTSYIQSAPNEVVRSVLHLVVKLLT
jgi:mRNA interferase MazF